MKRYLLFGGEWYYPNGGTNDFLGAFETAEEAKQAFDTEWAEIVTFDGENFVDICYKDEGGWRETDD